jgi:hypothetical protein
LPAAGSAAVQVNQDPAKQAEKNDQRQRLGIFKLSEPKQYFHGYILDKRAVKSAFLSLNKLAKSASGISRNNRRRIS